MADTKLSTDCVNASSVNMKKNPTNSEGWITHS